MMDLLSMGNYPQWLERMCEDLDIPKVTSEKLTSEIVNEGGEEALDIGTIYSRIMLSSLKSKIRTIIPETGIPVEFLADGVKSKILVDKVSYTDADALLDGICGAKKNYLGNLSPKEVFRRVIKGKNFITPTSIEYIESGHYVSEISKGNFMGEDVYGVTVVNRQDFTREVALSCGPFDTFGEAKNYAEELGGE